MTVSARRWFYEPLRVTGQNVRNADAAMALTARGCCPFCKAPVPEGEQCKCWNKEND